MLTGVALLSCFQHHYALLGLVLFRRAYYVEQDTAELFIELAKHNRHAVALNAYDLGRQTAVSGLSRTTDLKHYLQVGAVGERGGFGFDICTVKTDILECTSPYFDTVVGKHLHAGHATMTYTTIG